MKFETQKDLSRETKAINKLCELFDLKAEKLDDYDLDYKLYLKSGILFIYAEVKGRVNKTTEIYPLPIALRKIQKMQDDCGNYDCIIIWACEDGIIFGRYKELIGTVRYGGRTPRQGSANDLEMMIYYTKQDKLQTHLYQWL